MTWCPFWGGKPVSGEAKLVRTLARGAALRCGRCGSAGLFRRWFTMCERCPRCGMRFEREEGFFLGAYVMNYAAAALVVAVVLFVIIGVEANDANANLVPILGVGGLVALLVPIFSYPFSRTVWTAIELVMKPLEEREIAEAEAAVRFARRGEAAP